MVDAIAFCHSRGLVHRDLKPENILFHHRLIPASATDASETLTLEVKLADFGLGVVLAPGEFAQARIGSLMYEAPEVVCGSPYDAKADVWSLGIILHALLSGTLPFIDADQQRLARKICAGAYELRFSPWPFISVEAKALIRKLIVVDPRKRPTAAEILKDPWLAQFLEPSSPAAPRLSPSASRSLSPPLAPGTPPQGVPASRHSGQSAGSNAGRAGSAEGGEGSGEVQSKCREEVPEELQALGRGAESSSHGSEGRGGAPVVLPWAAPLLTLEARTATPRARAASPRRAPRPATAERRRRPRASMCCPFPELQLDASSLLACFFRPQAEGNEDAEEQHKAGVEKRQLLAPPSGDGLQEQEQEPAAQSGSLQAHGKKKGFYHQVGAEDPEACAPRPRTRRLRRLLTSHRAARF